MATGPTAVHRMLGLLCAAVFACVCGAASLAAVPKQSAAKTRSASAATPAPDANLAVPAVKTIAPATQNLPPVVHLLATPRAHITLHPAVADPARIVELSGRMGCMYSIRSVAPGIVEFLFPTSGLFRRGDPLFRLYDPALLKDLNAAQLALQNYDVRPLLIAAARSRQAGAPAGARTVTPASPGQGSVSLSGIPRDFPSPTLRPQTPPTVQVKPLAPAPASPPRPEVRPSAPQPKPVAPRPARLSQARPVPAPVDVEPYKQAVTRAEAALRDAQAAHQECEEDYAARKALVEAGAMAQRSLDEAADRLQVASAREADARALLADARERLADAQARAERAREAARLAAIEEQQENDQVEVLRGPTPEAASSTQAPAVQVIRGSSVAAPAAAPKLETPAPRTATVIPYRPPRASLSTLSAPPSGGLHYRGEGLITRSFSQAFPATPQELGRLSEQRWTEYHAPADGFVERQTAGDGTLIAPGQELLRVINTQWARTYIAVNAVDAERFRPGTVVTVTFDDYPDVLFEGWVNSLAPAEESDQLRAEVMLFCRRGYYGTDAFATLEWLALATPLGQDGEDVDPVTPVLEDSPALRYQQDPHGPLSLVPRDVWALSVPAESLRRSDDEYEGQMQLVELVTPSAVHTPASPDQKRLAALRKWRESFAEGMTRTLFADNVVLTYPRSGEIRRAIEKMATASVSHEPNLCARTMREALGWGLGDAHEWARELPSRGYVARGDGLARPGDILVWPFTFPPRGSQHIGIAVQQNGRLMLLSNLNGRLGTSPIEPGYLAFYKPHPPADER